MSGPTLAQTPVAVASSGGGSTNVQLQLGSPVGSGNLLVAYCFSRATNTTCSDTGGRTWTVYSNIDNVLNPYGSGDCLYTIWTAPVGVGGDTPTVTMSMGSTSFWIQGCLAEVTGADTSTTPISVYAVHSQSTMGTSVTIGPTGVSGAAELALSFFGEDGGGGNWTAPTGWSTAVQASPLNVGVSSLAVASQTVTAAWTSGTNDTQGGVIVVIKAASGGGSATAAAAIVEGLDSPAGSGASTIPGIAAIVEGHDALSNAAGSTIPGTAAIVEGLDSLSTAAGSTIPGTGAIVESYDVVNGAAFGGTGGSAGIVETFDTVSGAGSTQNTASSAVVEPGDVIVASAGTATASAATIRESTDLIVGVAFTGNAVQCSAAIVEGFDSLASAVVLVFRVQATMSGEYQGIYYNMGDVFDVSSTDFSDATVSIVPPGSADYPLYGWMLKVPSNTALYSYALATREGLSYSFQSVRGVDSAGHPIYSIPRTVA